MRPEICNVFTFHNIYSSSELVHEIDTACRIADIGCTDCKNRLGANIAEQMLSIHEKQEYYSKHINEVKDIIAAGNIQAAEVAKKTLEEVREAVKI